MKPFVARQSLLPVILFTASIPLVACSSVNQALKAAPAADSGFLPEPARLTRDLSNYPYNRAWEAPELVSTGEPIALYIAPVNLSRLKSNSWYYRNKGEAAEAIRKDAEKIARYLETAFRSRLAKEQSGRFHLTDSEPADGAVLEIAIVELTPTDVGRNLLGDVASAFVPGAGLLSLGDRGAIAIEGVVRRTADGKELFMFADREKGKMAPLNLNDFGFFSNARVAIDDWAKQFAKLGGTFGPVHVADTSAVTLWPL